MDMTRGLTAKTIKGVITRKFNEFVASIEDEKVRKWVERSSIVTGGCIASMLLGEEVNDFDIYFKDKATTEAVANYYLDKFKSTRQSVKDSTVKVDESGRVRIFIKSAGVAGESADETEAVDEPAVLEGDDEGAYLPVFLSSNAITLNGRVQLVIRFYGEPEAIHENFDFIHCTNYWTSWDGELVLNVHALECLMARELRYVGSKYPVCSMFRVRKFIERGWRINAGQILKMALQISQLDLHNISILEDQLVGVDALFFAMLIEALNKKFEDGQVPNDYLLELINRMF